MLDSAEGGNLKGSVWMTQPSQRWAQKKAQEIVGTWLVRDFEVWTKKKPTLEDWTPLLERVAIALLEADRGTREECAKIAESVNDCCECLDRECCKGHLCRVAQSIRQSMRRS